MTQCQKCGSRTTRRRLCKFCGIAERYGQSLIEEEQASETDETMTIECADCGLVSEVGRHEQKTPCQDCGHHGFRPVEVAR